MADVRVVRVNPLPLWTRCRTRRASCTYSSNSVYGNRAYTVITHTVRVYGTAILSIAIVFQFSTVNSDFRSDGLMALTNRNVFQHAKTPTAARIRRKLHGNPFVEFRESRTTIFIEEKTRSHCTHECIRVRLYYSIGTCDAEQLKSRSALYANTNAPPVGVRRRRCRQIDVTMRPRKTG